MNCSYNLSSKIPKYISLSANWPELRFFVRHLKGVANDDDDALWYYISWTNDNWPTHSLSKHESNITDLSQSQIVFSPFQIVSEVMRESLFLDTLYNMKTKFLQRG